MSIAKILERHQADLDEARKMLERPQVGGDDLKLSDSLKQRRTAEIQARIRTLEAERKAVVERIDAAIEEERKALEALGSQPADPPRPGRGGNINRPNPINNPVRGRAGRRRGPKS